MRTRAPRTRIGNALAFLRDHGFGLFVREVTQRLFPNSRYKAWIKENEPSEEELTLQKEMHFNCRPKISIVIVVGGTLLQSAGETLKSVLRQTYSHWELVVIDKGNASIRAREMLRDLGVCDARIRVERPGGGRDIHTNEIMALCTGEYLMFPGPGDTLAPFALYEVARAINETPEADIVYSDEDLMADGRRRRFAPNFKPDWSPDYLRSHNYIGHLAVIGKDILAKSGGLREGFDREQNYDLILRATERARNITHVPRILYHRRMHKASCPGRRIGEEAAPAPGQRALREHLARLGADGIVQDGEAPGFYKVTYGFDRQKISIVIPSRDHSGDLKRCIQSILGRSSYDRYEIIIVENGSVEARTLNLYDELRRYGNIRIINWEKPFNYSAVNNYAADVADGEVLLFLNNDMEVINRDWLERMLEHALRQDIGAVGAKLYYPDNTIQHAGVVLRPDGNVLHSHRFFPRAAFGYRARLRVVQNMSAVTGACIMVRKQVFSEVGGFDERYEVTFSDIDLCLKLRERGYLVVWTPYAELYHHESKTRGRDSTREKMERTEREASLFRARWRHVLEKGDPYYSPNLTRDKEDFSIRIP